MTNRKIWSRISTYWDLPAEKLLSGNPINNYLYDTILEVSEAANFPNPQNPGYYIKRYALKGVTPPDILNEAYYQCAKIVGDPNPEVDFYNFIEADIRENVNDRKDYVSLVFSVMYVLLSHMKTTPARVRRVLHLLDKKLAYDLCYFPAFRELMESFKRDNLHFVVNLNPRRFPLEDSDDYMPWDDEYEDIDVAIKTVLSSEDKDAQLNYIEKKLKEIESDQQPNMTLYYSYKDLKRSIELGIVKYNYTLPLSEEDTKYTSPEEVIARLSHRIKELTGTNESCASIQETEEQTPATLDLDEDIVSIPQLIEASSTFTPEEGDVILRFLQTFIANKEGNTMEQIKAAQKNLEARKSSVPASGEGFKGTIKINEKKFAKIDLIRIINALSEIGFFASTEGKTRIKTQCFITIGNALNVDLGDYNKDLTRSLQDNTKLEKHLEIFNKMAQAMTEYFNER